MIAIDYTLGYNLTMKSKATKEDTTTLIDYRESFADQLEKFANEKGYDGLRSIFREKKYFVASLGGIGYKSINTWEEAGLLLEDKEDREGGKWRKFDLVELTWFRIIHELRSVGVGLNQLAKVKTSLFYQFGNKDKKAVESKNLLDFFMAEVLDKKDVVLVVAPDGRSSMLLEEDYILSQLKSLLPSTLITLSLNRLLGDIFNNPELYVKNNIYYPLKENSRDTDLLMRISTDKDLKEVKIDLKNKKISRIYYKKHKDDVPDVRKIVRDFEQSGGNGDLILKKQDGKFVAVEQTDKT